MFEDVNPLRNDIGNLLLQTFESVFTKIADVDIEKAMLKKTKLGIEKVNSYYRQRFNQPRFIQDGMQRGIYLSFSDFLNNNPSLLKFTLEQDEEADYLYIEENGGQKLFTDFWGFSDGQNHYIKIGYNFFKLSRDANTYSFWGCYQAVHKTQSRSKNRTFRYFAFGTLAAELKTARLKNMLRPMQIDMETGKTF